MQPLLLIFFDCLLCAKHFLEFLDFVNAVPKAARHDLGADIRYSLLFTHVIERLLLNGRLKVVESRNRVLGDFRGPELEVLLLFLQIMGLLFHFLDDVAPVSELDGRLLDGLQLFAILHEELADLVLQLLLFLQVLFVLGRVKYFFVHILVFLHHFLQKLLLLCLLIGHVLNFVRLAGEERGLRLLLFQVLLSALGHFRVLVFLGFVLILLVLHLQFELQLLLELLILLALFGRLL